MLQTIAEKMFKMINFKAEILDNPMKNGLIMRIPYINLKPKMNGISCFSSNSSIFFDFFCNFSDFERIFAPIERPRKNEIWSAINVPKNAKNMTFGK